MLMFKGFVEQAEIKQVLNQSVELGSVLGSHKAAWNAQNPPAQPPSWIQCPWTSTKHI